MLIATLLACCGTTSAEPQAARTFMARTHDDVIVHGEAYFGVLDATAPLILLFHQGGSNGRGEYGELAPWLNEAGFRVIAWDQRAGGDTNSSTNRTIADLPDGTPAGFCDAYADLEAALEFTLTNRLAEQVVVWGSSYSGSLVFRLAADHPDAVSAVLAFSPAGGGPMVACRARLWVDRVRAPALVLRPAAEMERESSIEQREVLTAAGVEFRVVADGVHGSSMLHDGRTGHDMADARAAVIDWLREAIR